MISVLFVEDDAMIASGLVYALTQEGYAVTHCSSVQTALENLYNQAFSLGLIDLCLPDGTGYEVAGQLHQLQVPVIFLTAVDDEANTVKGLEMGAEDYITKPFRLQELLARIRAVLRRQGNASETARLRVTADIHIVPGQAKVIGRQGEIDLTALEYRLLLTFVRHRGQVLSRSQLLEGIWDVAGNYVNDNTLTVYVGRLREKLGDDPSQPVIIKTIRGMGYQLD